MLGLPFWSAEFYQVSVYLPSKVFYVFGFLFFFLVLFFF